MKVFLFLSSAVALAEKAKREKAAAIMIAEDIATRPLLKASGPFIGSLTNSINKKIQRMKETKTLKINGKFLIKSLSLGAVSGLLILTTTFWSELQL